MDRFVQQMDGFSSQGGEVAGGRMRSVLGGEFPEHPVSIVTAADQRSGVQRIPVHLEQRLYCV